MELTLSSMRSASLDVVESIMGQSSADDKALHMINDTIMARLKPEYRFEPMRLGKMYPYGG